MIPEYCDGCVKLVDGVCISYENSCIKVGLGGGGIGAIGCSFSPVERPEVITLEASKKRSGQQKQKGQDRSYKKGRKHR